MKDSEKGKRSMGTTALSEGVHVAPLMLLRNSIDQEFERFLSRFGASAVAPSAGAIGSFNPSVNVSEAEGTIRVQVELAGVSPEDVSLTIEGVVLTIQGVRKREEEKKDHEMYRREFSYGSFRRAITLPGEVDADKAHAEFRAGILTIEIPLIARTVTGGKSIPILGE